MMAKPGKECRDSLQNWKHKMQLCIDGEKSVDNPEKTAKDINHEVTEAKRLSVVINGMLAQLGKVLIHTQRPTVRNVSLVCLRACPIKKRNTATE